MAFPFSIIPGVVGLLGSIFGKKKSAKNQTQYTPMLSPEQQKYQNMLMQMMASRMGKPTQAQGIGNDVMGAMYQKYFGSGGPQGPMQG